MPSKQASTLRNCSQKFNILSADRKAACETMIANNDYWNGQNVTKSILPKAVPAVRCFLRNDLILKM